VEASRGEAPEGVRSFLPLLLALIVLVAVEPFFQPVAGGATVFYALLAGVLLAGVLSVSGSRRRLAVAAALGLPAIVAHALHFSTGQSAPLVVGLFFALAFQIFVAAVVIEVVVRSERVSHNVILGVASAYLLLGVVWAHLYVLLEVWWPGSFVEAGAPVSARAHLLQPLLYYSFVTLSTLGYGDIAPQTAPARALAALEAMTGQLFVAILIAVFVGRFLVEASRRP
jgi:hypothetical protein